MIPSPISQLVEKTESLKAVKLSCQWADLGSWPQLNEFLDKDRNRNFLPKNNLSSGVEKNSSFVMDSDKVLIALGVKDLFLVENADTIYYQKEYLDDLSRLARAIPKFAGKEGRKLKSPIQPWGSDRPIYRNSEVGVNILTVARGVIPPTGEFLGGTKPTQNDINTGSSDGKVR